MDELAVAKLEMVGLDADVLRQIPVRAVRRHDQARGAGARARARSRDRLPRRADLRPRPDRRRRFRRPDRARLQRTLGLTVFMVTHDLDSLHTVCDRIAVLADGKVIAAGTMETMLASEHPWLKAYFHGKRSRARRARASTAASRRR